MKKINALLITITLICSTITIIRNPNQNIIMILKDASIILTIFLPYIIEKIFKIKLQNLKTIWIIFIFMAHYLGVTLEFYNQYNYFDKITHTISGIITAYVATIILNKTGLKNKHIKILFILSFTSLCAGMWEIFEFTCDNLFKVDAQRVAQTGVSDTMWDIIVALIGAAIYTITQIKTKIKKTQTTYSI